MARFPSGWTYLPAAAVAAGMLMLSVPAAADPSAAATEAAATETSATDAPDTDAAVPHLSSLENLPPGTTDTRDQEGHGLSYLRELWQAYQTQEISGKGALLLLTQRPMDPASTPPPGLPTGPQAPPSNPGPPVVDPGVAVDQPAVGEDVQPGG